MAKNLEYILVIYIEVWAYLRSTISTHRIRLFGHHGGSVSGEPYIGLFPPCWNLSNLARTVRAWMQLTAERGRGSFGGTVLSLLACSVIMLWSDLLFRFMSVVSSIHPSSSLLISFRVPEEPPVPSEEVLPGAFSTDGSKNASGSYPKYWYPLAIANFIISLQRKEFWSMNGMDIFILFIHSI